MVRSQTNYIAVLQIKKIVEKGLRHLFVTSSSSHFFNKTDFEQYLFNENAIVTILPQFCPISTLAGMNLDHEFFQVSKLSKDQK